MKKILAVLMAVSLLLGVSFSAAEEPQTPSDFLQALAGWIQNLNLDESDYFASAGWENSPVYQGTLRKNQGITELSVPNIGRAQISDKKIMLDIGEHKYGIDLSKLTELVQSFSSGENAITKDLDMLRPWLEKAYTDIILPSIKINYSFCGLSIHIDADDERIKERTYAFIDELMAERKTVETVLEHYGSYLVQFIPGMPQTFDDLQKAWESEKENQMFYWRDFNLGADITYSQGFSGLSVSGHVNLYLQWLFGADLSFELKSSDEGVDFLASLDLTNYRDVIKRSSNKLGFHMAGEKIDGFLELDGYTYTLKAEKAAEENGKCRYTANLAGMYAWHEIFVKFDLDAVYDPADQSLDAVMYEIWDVGTSYEKQQKIAVLELRKGTLGWDAQLSLPYDFLSLHLSAGDQYGRLRLEHKGSSGYRNNWYIDAWLYYSSDEYRIKMETDLFDYYKRTPRTYALTLQKHGVEFSVSEESGTRCHARISYIRTLNGFEADIEYMNIWALRPFNTGGKPSRMKVVQEGNSFGVELEWRELDVLMLSATGTLELDDSGGFRRLSIDATQYYDQYGTEQNKSYHLTVIPDTVTYVDYTGIYELRITENTAEKLAVKLTKDYKDELGSLILTLDANGEFNSLLTVMGQEKGSIEIRPVSKVPIDVISEENALLIDINTLQYLLGIRY